MRKKYLTLSLVLAALPLAASAQAQSLDSSVNIDLRPVQIEVKTRVNSVDVRPVTIDFINAASSTLEARRAEMEAKRTQMRVEAEAKRAEVRADVEANRIELRADVVEKKLANTVRVMLATIERLENIGGRIASRIEKLKARGVDTSESERYLVEARSDLSFARGAVETMSSVDLSNDSIRDDFERIRALAAEVRTHLRSAHENLMLAVRNLSAVEADVEVESDSAQ